MGLKPPQKIFFENISTNKATRGFQSFGLLEGAAFFRVSNDQNFYVKLVQSYDEHMLKISKRYLKWFLSNHGFTEKFWSTSAYVQ